MFALACVVPDLCTRLYALVQERRFEEARTLQARLVPLARTITSTHGVPGLKAARDLVEYVGGGPRPPLRPLPREAVDQIRMAEGQLREAALASEV